MYMVFDYGVVMENIRFDGKLKYRIDNVGYIQVVRNANYLFEYKKGKELFSFIYVKDGEIEYTFTEIGKSVHLKKDSLLYIPKHYPYYTTYLKENTAIRIFTFDIETNTLPAFLSAHCILKSPDTFSVFNSINNQNTLLIYSNIYRLLYIMQDESQTVPLKYRNITPAINRIKQKYFENHKISYYAELCNMSESNFRKLFREYTKMSPIEYRNKIRIAQARRMIEAEGYTVLEAAYITGFNNMSFFYETYNKYKNMHLKSF